MSPGTLVRSLSSAGPFPFLQLLIAVTQAVVSSSHTRTTLSSAVSPAPPPQPGQSTAMLPHSHFCPRWLLGTRSLGLLGPLTYPRVWGKLSPSPAAVPTEGKVTFLDGSTGQRGLLARQSIGKAPANPVPGADRRPPSISRRPQDPELVRQPTGTWRPQTIA